MWNSMLSLREVESRIEANNARLNQLKDEG